MQGLFQLNRLSGMAGQVLPLPPGLNFYRLWVVEDHTNWITTSFDQDLDLSKTIWFFPKYYKPGIPPEDIKGYTFWFDDLFLAKNPILEATVKSAFWKARNPFLLSAGNAFSSIRNLCHDHQDYLSTDRPPKDPLGYTTATLLVLHLWQATQENLLVASASQKNSPALSFLQLVDQYYKVHHQPGFYAGQLHLTLATLRRHCREYINQSPSEIIQRKLVEEAKKLLLETNESIKEIAFILGFEDESYFIRFFRQQVLLPPRAYRKSFLPTNNFTT